MVTHRAFVAEWLVLTGVAAAGFLVVVLVVRPLAAPQVNFDTAAAVIHFQRIGSGQRLEAFVTTTPKPLMTLVDGLLHGAGGWTAVAWSAMLIHGLAAGFAAALAWRAMGVVAAAIVAVAFIGNRFLLLEAANAYAVPWAVALWSLAGLAVTLERPRWTFAGVALLLATLARFETLVLVAAIAVALVVVQGRARQGATSALMSAPRTAWVLVALPLTALPAMLVHDWLLTGDPMFWASVSARYTDEARLRTTIGGPIEVTRALVDLRLVRNPVPAAMAVVGIALLAWYRGWPLLIGLTALGPVMAAFLVCLAARGTYVSGRYHAPIDLAIVFSAAVGVRGIVIAIIDRMPAAAQKLVQTPAGRLTLAGGTAILTIAAAMPWGPMDSATVNRIGVDRAVQADAARAVPLIAEVLDRIPGSRARPPADASVTVSSNRPPLLLVPGLLRPRMAVDLGLPLDVVAKLTPAALESGHSSIQPQDRIYLDEPRGALLSPGQVIYHDRRAEAARPEFAFLEAGEPFTARGLSFHPILARPDRGVWVLEVRSLPGKASGLGRPASFNLFAAACGADLLPPASPSTRHSTLRLRRRWTVSESRAGCVPTGTGSSP